MIDVEKNEKRSKAKSAEKREIYRRYTRYKYKFAVIKFLSKFTT